MGQRVYAMDKKEVKRKRIQSAARARRRRRRKRIVMIERIVIVLLLVAVLAGGGVTVYRLMPGIKLARQIKEADGYMETQDYDGAIASYQQVLEMDSSSVEAYRAMAVAYLDKEDTTSAEQILYQGWETTQDESLLQYYCTVRLNEAVEEINAQNCTMSTLDKIISVIEKDPDNEDGFRLLDACYDRLFSAEAGQSGFMCDMTVEGECGYKMYQDMMLRFLLLYEGAPSDNLRDEIFKFALPQYAVMWFETEHLQEYLELLGRIAQMGSNDQVMQLTACLQKAADMQEFFAQAFTIFESGEFEPIKDFMQNQDYIAIRDQFLEGTMEYWSGAIYIPVSRERMKLLCEEGSYSFSFADFGEYPETAGVVNVWGAKQEDAGVQRLCISYEPASQNGEYYPHTTYEFIYLYSNVKIRGNYVPEMNYRFETRVATPEGTTAQLIGDWGGEHEWTTEY